MKETKRAMGILEGMEVGEPRTVAAVGLTVVPLLSEGDGVRGYITLDEAVKEGLVVIPESGDVPKVIVEVRGEKPVLVVEGDIVVGGWQNRVVNISLLLEPGKSHTIPVSCVEQGRWRPRWFGPFAERRVREEPLFFLAECAAFAELRAAKVRSLSRALIAEHAPRADQGLVWERVRRKLMEAGVRSPTADLFDFYESRKGQIEEIVGEFVPVDGQVGAVIGLKGKVAGLEAFDHPETWRVRWRKVLSAYVADAIGPSTDEEKAGVEGLSREQAEEFLIEAVSAFKARAKRIPAPVGLGEHHLLTNGGLEGFALVHKGRAVHTLVFSAEAGRL